MPHEIRRWIITNKSPNELCGNEACGARMVGQNVDHGLAITDTAGIDFVTENEFFSVIVHPWTEHELAAQLRPVNGPARKGPRHFLDVLLRIAAVNTQRVQFHQLPSVILIDTFDG